MVCLVIMLSGCEKNPLIGEWKAKSGQGHLFIMCPEITFTSETSRCGNVIEEVDYEVQGNAVIVSSELGNIFGMKAIYDVPDKNTMVIKLPAGGKIVYGRTGY